MKSKKSKPYSALSESTVSANECTGALQQIYTSEQQLRRFHDEYNEQK